MARSNTYRQALDHDGDGKNGGSLPRGAAEATLPPAGVEPLPDGDAAQAETAADQTPEPAADQTPEPAFEPEPSEPEPSEAEPPTDAAAPPSNPEPFEPEPSEPEPSEAEPPTDAAAPSEPEPAEPESAEAEPVAGADAEPVETGYHPPCVGAPVLYGLRNGVGHIRGQTEFAATVTAAAADGTVSVAIFPPGQGMQVARGVKHQSQVGEGAENYWRWHRDDDHAF